MNSVSVPNEIMLEEVRRQLALGNKVELLTKGCSMLPFIRGGKDSVRLVNKPFAVGDAVLAHTVDGRWVLHRIASIEGELVRLKGDGNLRGEEECLAQNVAGVVEAILLPSGKEKPSTSAKRAARWNALPYFIRRYTLAIYRRLI